MPSIAASVRSHGAQFYWHLGDFRAIYTFDEDMLRAASLVDNRLTVSSYLATAWDDFRRNQLRPFEDTPVFLGIGNHELIPPMDRSQFLIQFADWFDTPIIKDQRLRDDPNDHLLRTYYHWHRDGIDFISLDNASIDQFDELQMTWLRKVLANDALDGTVRALVVGMHEALPDSLADFHSMSQSVNGQATGRAVYQALLGFRETAHVPVYLLASHSHFVLEDAFNSDYWQRNGGVLPGWIIGAAGAVRYPLPDLPQRNKLAKTHVYGYLLATVTPDLVDPVHFTLQEITEPDISDDVKARFTADGVHWCFDKN